MHQKEWKMDSKTLRGKMGHFWNTSRKLPLFFIYVINQQYYFLIQENKDKLKLKRLFQVSRWVPVR